MAGLLGGFFGAPTEDPLGGLLRTNYNAGDQRAEGISEALKAASQAFLHPAQGGTGSIGIGAIGDAMSKAGTAYKGGKASYLATALAKEQVQRKIEADNYALQRQTEQDQALADMVAGLPPEQRKMLQNNPELAQKFGEEWAEAQFAKQTGSGNVYGPGNVVEMGTDAEGNPIYGREQPSYQGDVPLIQPFPKNVRPAWDPSLRRRTKEEEEGGKVTGKTQTERYFEDVDFAQNVGPHIGSMDRVIAGADQFGGMSASKVKEAGLNMEAYGDYLGDLGAVQAVATAAALDEAKLYPMTETDREFVKTMATGGLSQWRSPERIKKLTGILRESTRKRLSRIKEGKSLQMPDIDAILKQFDTSGTVTPPTEPADTQPVVPEEEEWGFDAKGNPIRLR